VNSADLISNPSQLKNYDVKLGHMPTIEQREKNRGPDERRLDYARLPRVLPTLVIRINLSLDYIRQQ